MSLKNKLNRMKSHIVREEKEVVPKQPEPAGSIEIPFIESWIEHGVKPYYLDGDYCLILEKTYDLSDFHGKYQLGQIKEAVGAWNQFDGTHPLSAKGLAADDLFFFDTETTGLGGGTGNTIFLLGYAKLSGDKLVLRQHILPQPGSEIPLYHSFLEKVDYNTLVTYNGKAFDWPQVKTRHTLIREHVPKLPSFGHFDLFHGSRRLWKSKMDSVKLSNVEKEILDFHRTDDVPGYLAPMIFFDFVERKDPEGMLKVLLHNELDILSLVVLYVHLSFQILGIDSCQTPDEKLLVGKWFDYLGDKEQAIDRLEKLIGESAGKESLAAKHSLAFQYKRMKKYQEAYDFWHEVSEAGPRELRAEACIELAKLAEHQFKEFEGARMFSIKAYEEMENRAVINDKIVKELAKRIQRLERKLAK
ncbi:ribonuclease H-like domain-containing protein [Bacillus sp. SCS-153A]|uniref:ribonuclease H-like domain-containing protein n=1 Tax=Rossellomorea sedimentorum TaxID=3115294 RepID=UPI003905EE62